MIEYVRQFVLKEEARGQFELAYGPGGAWSKLFAGRPGFRGTTVLRDQGNPRRYLTIDLWETETQREQALAECKAEHSGLEAALDEWVESKIDVGVYGVLAEATVRPRGRSRRSKTGDARLSSHRITPGSR